MNIKEWEDNELIKELNRTEDTIKEVSDEIKNNPSDSQMLKKQLKALREFRSELKLELDLRGITNARLR